MKKTISLILTFFLSQCFLCCGFVRDEQIVGKYHIFAVDTENESCLGYQLEDGNSICIVPPKVVAYCKNGQYILVKQMDVENKKKLNYYIVPILSNNQTVFPDDSIVGPLNRNQFDKEILKMRLGNLEFKKIN
ncbi:hypothetical protein ASG38_17235 [Flavobacterium sp. Leaf359]|uniref:hypothetical protein n=1 Tax=Flavobacterium sp. Leaf359 TaxID=1736351 RepID=UPI0006F7AE4A|nr:hypothetical protein [Flavobacterium sp. Leaf359]KQS52579.1 hypothetical protein ASG38_17235 [Flavobacterium sp. Leaf359]